jgi:antirestriction protein ArdC
MPDQPEITHALTATPSYHPTLDRITLPHLSQFEDADHYFATLAHEATHASGHPQRLNRFSATEPGTFEAYSFEELVAEFGAAFLCGFAGIANPLTEQLQASYIDGWARVLRQDPQMLVRAASAAQRAADYIRGKVVLESDAADATDATEAAEAPLLEPSAQRAAPELTHATAALG